MSGGGIELDLPEKVRRMEGRLWAAAAPQSVV